MDDNQCLSKGLICCIKTERFFGYLCKGIIQDGEVLDLSQVVTEAQSSSQGADIRLVLHAIQHPCLAVPSQLIPQHVRQAGVSACQQDGANVHELVPAEAPSCIL